jgi:peroxiredoxin Q/BCP
MLNALFLGPLPIGTPAPPFALQDENDRTVSLESLRGKPAVLVFYPGDDTAICTKQLCAIRDDWSAFKRLGAAVFGINGQGADSHGRFAAKFKLPFPLLVDHHWRMCRAYRAGWGIVIRTVYVLGPTGLVIYAKRGRPSTAEILAAIEGPKKNAATS